MYKIVFLTFLALTGLKSQNAFSQNQKEKEKELYTALDKELSSGNALVNNGKFQIDNSNNLDNEHRYFSEDRLYSGDISYNNQLYFNNKVKYDLLKDEVVINPENQSEKILIILDKTKVDYFTIQNRKFVKVKLNEEDPAEYLEENLNAKNFIFYIKYKKNFKEIIKDNSLYSSYTSQNKFYVKIDNTIHEVRSKKSILKLYPELKSVIEDYYKFSGNLESENNVKFMENLMLAIKKSSLN
ncbi:hypothetical protein NAT51_04175 [Flavobacterium amniphilum]|uniref:hypothetical protein n=1 Tax=Flavobacterium amniphilum TaxID=1834035 RepID=UPI00202A658C|nr:hypothetical protein [Flavobacterium amniphilum]MCL9804705.1 hypothetical protein [Flavobacterium amniphilum]